GPVRVHLTASGQTVSARLTVQGETARHLLESELPALRQRLQDAGVTLGRLDVAPQDRGSRGQGGWETVPPVSRPAPVPALGPAPAAPEAAAPATGINVMA